MSAQFPL